MIKVYIAGPISDPNPIKLLQNIRAGICAAARLIGEGYAPFCPHLDYQYFLQWTPSEAPDIDQIKAVSLEWLKQCDAVILLPGWRTSHGSRIEFMKAEYLGIPVFFNIENLDKHFATNKEREGNK